MLVYTKLSNYLKANGMLWKDLQNALSISPTVMAKLQKDRPCNTETINKVCEYLKVQPADIMEWIPDEEYEKQNSEKIAIERQIEELKSKLRKM